MTVVCPGCWGITERRHLKNTECWGGEAETRKGLPKEVIARLSPCGGRARCRTNSMNSYKGVEACIPSHLGLKRYSVWLKLRVRNWGTRER